MDDSILSEYILKLETDSNKIIGVYRQGSDILGYADKHSDTDYAVVWDKEFPNKSLREDRCSTRGFEVTWITDQAHKGTDRFEYKGTAYNIAHRLDTNFLTIYDELSKGEINEIKLYLLGGFYRGKIIYDPNNVLKEYREKLKVTDTIISSYCENNAKPIENNIESLEVAAERKQPIAYIKSLNYLLITLSIQLYLENRHWPNSPKWIEKDAQKYGWDNKLLEVIKRIKYELTFDDIAQDLIDYIRQ